MPSGPLMIVEDDPLVAEDLRSALSHAGFDVPEPCHDYRQALLMLERLGPTTCVLDLHLGGNTAGLAHVADEGRRLFWLLQARGVRTVIHSGHRAELASSIAPARRPRFTGSFPSRPPPDILSPRCRT